MHFFFDICSTTCVSRVPINSQSLNFDRRFILEPPSPRPSLTSGIPLPLCWPIRHALFSRMCRVVPPSSSVRFSNLPVFRICFHISPASGSRSDCVRVGQPCFSSPDAIRPLSLSAGGQRADAVFHGDRHAGPQGAWGGPHRLQGLPPHRIACFGEAERETSDRCFAQSKSKSICSFARSRKEMTGGKRLTIFSPQCQGKMRKQI